MDWKKLISWLGEVLIVLFILTPISLFVYASLEIACRLHNLLKKTNLWH